VTAFVSADGVMEGPRGSDCRNAGWTLGRGHVRRCRLRAEGPRATGRCHAAHWGAGRV